MNKIGAPPSRGAASINKLIETEKNEGEQMRVAVLLDDRCQPKKCDNQCHDFCPPVRNGQECIVFQEKSRKPIISEQLCIGCGICVNKCPFDALVIHNLPEELESNMIHRYGRNGFRLFRLPAPREEKVVGVLGQNGMGKSTAINILSGEVTPNLGDWLIEAAEWDDIIQTLPKGELRDYLTMVAGTGVRVALKPQYVDHIPKAFKGKVGELLRGVDERGTVDEVTAELGIDHLLERHLPQLSGGELQRVAIAATLLKDADVYFFDEPSSYLDIYERMRIVKILQKLSEGHRVIVIEHDLAILDVLCDLVHIVYGKRAAFGIFTPARTTRKAINSYLDGFLVEENVRIRDKPISFVRGSIRAEEIGAPILEWGNLEKTLGDFKLTTGEGKLHEAEVVGVVGPNATGKTTLARIFAGELEMDEGWCTMEAKVSYKPQHITAEFPGTVREWLDAEIGTSWHVGEFQTRVVRPLEVDTLLELDATRLSGGELQAVSIVICLGRDADIYLLDEPSAHLDANARMEAAKAIRRTMEMNEKSAMVIDHDIYFIDIVSDSLLVFEGEGGLHGEAVGPLSLRKGMNRFLKGVGVTFRRDYDSKRPRINKNASQKDREQKASNDYYYS
ncbi:MAG: ribosome biogenesis/translation initiation ATPase RLI [Candidatus Thalassarchaeaceae archaeon]|nr:ribosome biogenesis/translation initiation ATPase RLI [Candidatus Thalassarchaeaceae archaeon]